MPDDGKVITWKFANALIAGAQPVAIPRLPSFGLFEGFRKMFGGLWVGGSVTLNTKSLSFSRNAMNAALHSGLDDSTTWPLERVTSVRDRFGVLTRIIDVKFDDGVVFTFRCFGARAFARQIAEQAGRTGRILH